MTAVPRWLELQAEIDYRLFLLGEMQRQAEGTGLDEARLAEAEEIIAEIKTLRAEWDALTAPAEDGQAPADGG